MLAGPATVAATAPSVAATAQPTPSPSVSASLPHPSILVTTSQATKAPPARAYPSGATRNVAGKRAAKSSHNSWDPKSFGGRL